MADPKNLGSNGNMNNSTGDDRVIWEDGKWAIIEAGDAWDGLARSKTRDNLGDAISAGWDPGMTVMPGPQSVRARKLVKVALKDLLAHRPGVQGTPAVGMPRPQDYKTPPGTPVAPPSPFMKKPWDPGPMPGMNVPEFPHVCRICGGRFYQGLNNIVHEATEHTALRGACPGSQKPDRADMLRRARP